MCVGFIYGEGGGAFFNQLSTIWSDLTKILTPILLQLMYFGMTPKKRIPFESLFWESLYNL